MSTSESTEKSLIQWLEDKETGEKQARMVYKLNQPLTMSQIKELVQNALTIKVAYAGDSVIKQGFLRDLYSVEGNNCLPVKSEGLVHMYWRQYYDGHSLEDSLKDHQELSDSLMPDVAVKQYICGEVTGPNATMVRFYKGAFPIHDPILAEGIYYVWCRDRVGEVVDVPMSVKSLFFSRFVQPLVGKLHEEKTYSYASFEYAAQYVDRHVAMANKIFSRVPAVIQVVEPGCGAGIVGQFRQRVVCGDLYPPSGHLGIVKRETISETLQRSGKDTSIFYCAYIDHFLSEDDRSFLKGKMVIWQDTPMRVLPGKEIFPGLHFENIPQEWEPQSFQSEKNAHSLPLKYTENLLNGRSYAILQESEYSRYLRSMRPHIQLEILEGYEGLFHSQIKEAARVLCVTIEDVLKVRHSGRRIYFAPVGAELTDIFTSQNLISVNGDTQVYYEPRQLYSISSADQLLRAYFSHLPSKVIGDRFYFFDPNVSDGAHRRIEIKTPLHFLKGELIPTDGMRDVSDCELSLTQGNRLYAKRGSLSIPLRWNGSYVTLQYVLRALFRHNISKDQMQLLLDFSDKAGGNIPQNLRDKLLFNAGTHHWVTFLKNTIL